MGSQIELSGLLKIKKDMKLVEVDPGGIQGKRKGIYMIKTHCVHVRSTQRIDKTFFC